MLTAAANVVRNTALSKVVVAALLVQIACGSLQEDALLFVMSSLCTLHTCERLGE